MGRTCPQDVLFPLQGYLQPGCSLRRSVQQERFAVGEMSLARETNRKASSSSSIICCASCSKKDSAMMSSSAQVAEV